MTTATKNRKSKGKNPVVPSRDQIISAIMKLGGEAEVKRYERVEGLERLNTQKDVIHRWKVGDILKVSFKEHDDEVIRVYSVGLQRAQQTLKLSVRLAELYSEAEIRKMILEAAAVGHELNWAHFRQLLREDLTMVQRAELAARVAKNRWSYRELQNVIEVMVGGKKSQGGRKPNKIEYKTYTRAVSAMKMRSQAWLTLEDDWIGQVKVLVAKLSASEKFTPEFLALTNNAAQQLRAVAARALRDAEEAEAIAAEVSKAMGGPELQVEKADDGLVMMDGAYRAEVAAKVNGVPKAKAKGKPRPKTGARPRLARHPKMLNGRVVAN